MIKITIELLPGGDETKATKISEAYVINDATHPDIDAVGFEGARHGNYQAFVAKPHHFGSIDGILEFSLMEGEVKNHDRRQHVTRLVGKALLAAEPVSRCTGCNKKLADGEGTIIQYQGERYQDRFCPKCYEDPNNRTKDQGGFE